MEKMCGGRSDEVKKRRRIGREYGSENANRERKRRCKVDGFKMSWEIRTHRRETHGHLNLLGGEGRLGED